MEPLDGPIQLPAGAGLDWAFASSLAAALDAATRRPPASLPETLPASACIALVRRAEKLLKAEPTLLHVHPPEGSEAVVVGDIHGQFHDLLTIFATAGAPSPSRLYLFDGDFVDRGAWGLEVLLTLAAYKVAAPTSVFLLRGNHESTYCSLVYGFRAEVLAKYGEKEGAAVYKACQSLFSHLPLAAVVAGSTLVLHGGLPRAPPRRRTRRSSVSADDGTIAVASLADIAAASKGGDDPEPETAEHRVAVDCLWSDPAKQPGVQLGARPGDVGILFGLDVTEAFLRDNGLRLILRGHEGPDSRALRPDMPSILPGFCLDHETPAGRLYTVFSAPHYPQFGLQHPNQGAVAVLAGPSYDQPRFLQFSAAPRPEAVPYYSLSTDSEEYAASDGEELPSVEEQAGEGGGASSSGSSEADDEEEEAAIDGGSSEDAAEGEEALQQNGHAAAAGGSGEQHEVSMLNGSAIAGAAEDSSVAPPPAENGQQPMEEMLNGMEDWNEASPSKRQRGF